MAVEGPRTFEFLPGGHVLVPAPPSEETGPDIFGEIFKRVVAALLTDREGLAPVGLGVEVAELYSGERHAIAIRSIARDLERGFAAFRIPLEHGYVGAMRIMLPTLSARLPASEIGIIAPQGDYLRAQSRPEFLQRGVNRDNSFKSSVEGRIVCRCAYLQSRWQ